MMRMLVALALAGLVAAPAVAAGQPAGKKKEHKICKEVGRTGSNLPLRVCRTPTQWADNQAAQADDLDLLTQQHKEAGAMSGVPEGMSAPR
jgi:hypothetical protein